MQSMPQQVQQAQKLQEGTENFRIDEEDEEFATEDDQVLREELARISAAPELQPRRLEYEGMSSGPFRRRHRARAEPYFEQAERAEDEISVAGSTRSAPAGVAGVA